MKNLFVVVAALVVAVLAGEGYFWHFTDVHLQMDYKVGGDPSSRCHGSGSTAKKYGSYKCDLPMVTVKALAKFAADKTAELGIKPNFIFWGGDIMSGRDSDWSQANLKNHVANWTNFLKDALKTIGGNTKFFPVLGNHDAAPKQHQFNDKSDHYSYSLMNELWKEFVSESSVTTIKKGGYYTEEIIPGLRFVALNTAMYFVDNEALKVDKNTDPLGQFAWLKKVLSDARAAGEKVIIGSHIAPGLSAGAADAMYHDWSDKMVEVLDGFHKDVIVAGFYGHNHVDTFKLVSDVTSTPKSSTVAFLASSGTSGTDINPSVSLVKFSTEAPYTILDRTVYYINLDKANKEDKITWAELYSTTKAYNIPDLTASSMNGLIDKLANKDGPEWKEYLKNLYAGTPNHTVSVAGHKKRICVMRHSYQKDVEECINAI